MSWKRRWRGEGAKKRSWMRSWHPLTTGGGEAEREELVGAHLLHGGADGEDGGGAGGGAGGSDFKVIFGGVGWKRNEWADGA